MSRVAIAAALLIAGAVRAQAPYQPQPCHAAEREIQSYGLPESDHYPSEDLGFGVYEQTSQPQ
jgi:hypothetical protein